jgi:NAD(P)-dependent dehydrogenase (short-subunit alcohol dehydrogenase family)
MPREVAVVTGAGRGLGKAIAINLSKEGFFVVICSRTSKQITEVERAMREYGGEGMALCCDIGIEDQVERFIDEVSNVTGRIDMLVNNAGIAYSDPITKIDSSRWEEIIRVNLTGTFLMTKYALKHMGYGGHIFNVISNAGKTGFPNWSAYCASKFGVLGFTNSIREELRDRSIKVTAVLPGPTDTPLWEGIEGVWDSEKMMKPDAVADIIISIYKQPDDAVTEEVLIMPRGGAF